MYSNNKNVVDYHIVFTDSDLRHWVMKWLHPEIKHVLAVKKSAGGQFWIVIDPLSSYTNMQLYCVDEYPHPRCIYGNEVVILPVRSYIDPEKPRYKICIFSCVEVVKSLLGIRKWWILTPYQLFKYLKKRGLKYGQKS